MLPGLHLPVIPAYDLSKSNEFAESNYDLNFNVNSKVEVNYTNDTLNEWNS